MTNFLRLLSALSEQQVDFVIIGGVAMVLHGSTRVTQDLDLCYNREPANLHRLAVALAPFDPRLRDAPPTMTFRLDERALCNGLNFTLATTAGDLDLLGEVLGVGGYAALRATAVPMKVHGAEYSVMDLSSLEKAKAAAGRLKDALDLAELRLLRARGRGSRP